MKQKTKLTYMLAIVLALAFGFISFAAIAKNDNAKNEKSDKASTESKSKKKTTASDLKNFEKPDKAKGETNAQVHKQKVEEAVEGLEQVVAQEEVAGNTEVSEVIAEVIAEQEATQDETVEAIEELEKQSKVKTFLFGTEYKNLGQLRSSLVHNENQIRKITQTISKMQSGGDVTALQEQLVTFTAERERIKGVIYDQENNFSLFGWLFRFMNGYEPTPVDDTSDDDLIDEIKDVIEIDPTDPVTPVVTDPTDPTDPVTPVVTDPVVPAEPVEEPTIQ